MSAPSQSLFLTNPQAQAAYGAVLTHYEGRMERYTAVLVMTERELQILNDRGIVPETSPPDQMRAAVREMYPDRPVDVLFPNDEDIRTLLRVAVNGEEPEPGKKVTAAPGAASVQLGSPSDPMRVGVLIMPQNMNMTPEDMGYIAAGQRRNQPSGPEHEQRVSDTRTMVASHELHHLLHAAAENSFTQSAIPGANIRASSQGGETYADRQMLADLPELQRAGLISNTAIASDYIAARQIATYSSIVQASPVRYYDSDTGQTSQRIPLKNHDTGFSLNSGDALEAQEGLRRQTGTEVNGIYRNALNQMYADAGEGRASPETQAVYEDAMQRVTRNIMLMDALNGVRSSDPKTQQQLDREEKLRRETFDDAMIASPGFKREIAQQIVRMPTADTSVTRMAGEYMMALDRLVTPREAAPKEPAAETGQQKTGPAAVPLKPVF